jgi:hypothetical protein
MSIGTDAPAATPAQGSGAENVRTVPTAELGYCFKTQYAPAAITPHSNESPTTIQFVANDPGTRPMRSVSVMKLSR